MLMEIFEKIDELLDQLGVNYEITQEDGEIKIKIEDNRDEKRKEEFERLVNKVDDDLFQSALDKFDKTNLSERYKETPEEVYEEFIDNLKIVFNDKIKELEDLEEELVNFLEA